MPATRSVAPSVSAKPSATLRNTLLRAGTYVSQKLVFHRGLADDDRGINRIPPARDCPEMEDREFCRAGVVAEMIAEGTLHAPLSGGNHSLQYKLGGGRN